MKKTLLLSKISLNYWKYHKKRFFTFMILLILGVVALSCASLLIRSEKQAVLDEELRLLGDYDVIVYDLEENTADKITSDDNVSASGMYYNLGYIQNEFGVQINAAAFADENSENMYHMACLRGQYPQNENQIALDVSAAKSIGIKPYPGEKIKLSLYSDEGEHLMDKEFTVSGLFEAANEGAYGGWLRYPESMDIDSCNMPGIFFNIDMKDIFKSSNVTIFVQSDLPDLNTISNRFIDISNNTIDWEQIDIPSGRRFAYTYVLGALDTIQEEYGDYSLSSITQAMKDGKGIKDFYSGVLMPIFTATISLIVILSVIGITKNIIRDKQESFAILRSVGLDRKRLYVYIMCDFTAAALICIAVGLALGSLTHIGMITFLNNTYNLNLQYGFLCSEYVEAVTVNPFILSAVTIILCVEVSVLISLAGFIGKSPIQMFSEKNRNKNRKSKNSGHLIPTSWKRLLTNKISLHNGSIAVISIVVLGASLFGYTYFHALSDLNNNEYKFEKQEYGLENWDYKAEKSDQAYMYEFNIENHHDYGVSTKKYSELKDQPFVKNIFGEMINRSTRLVYNKDQLSEDVISIMNEFNLRKYDSADKDDEFENALKDAENAMISEIGYDNNELIYNLPTVGLFDEDLDQLNKYVVDGKINKEKLDKGEEVLLAVPQSDLDKYLKLFRSGDKLPLSDVILNSTEEQLDFGRFMPSEFSEPVYKNNVISPEGDEIELTSYAFGTRNDINTKIGAILALDDEAVMKYMVSCGDEIYGVNAVCSIKEFSSWGLKDSNITNLCVEINDDRSFEEADNYWYSMMSDVKGMSTHSTAEITARMNNGTLKIMSIYYSMIIILIIIALITVAISLYTDIRIRSSKFAVLRACGMSVSQISYIIIRQNIFYPLIGFIFSIVPVSLCQRYFIYIRENVDSGAWSSIQSDGIPWYHYVPFRYDLFKYNIFTVMAVIFIIYLLLILIVTLPQLHYLRNQSITEEIEKSNF